jgi:hypothetical protein
LGCNRIIEMPKSPQESIELPPLKLAPGTKLGSGEELDENGWPMEKTLEAGGEKMLTEESWVDQEPQWGDMDQATYDSEQAFTSDSQDKHVVARAAMGLTVQPIEVDFEKSGKVEQIEVHTDDAA